MPFEGFSRYFSNEKELANTDVETLTSPEGTFEAFSSLLLANGFQEYRDVNDAYKSLPSDELIVRREDPQKILKILNGEESYPIEYVGGEAYSNCVEWNPRTQGSAGIQNAYLEGFTELNNVVTVIGFKQKAGDSVQKLPDATSNFHGLERQYVRSFNGSVTLDQVAFINLRIPAHLLPEEKLTENELDALYEYQEAKKAGTKPNPVMVHRSFINEGREVDEEIEMKKAA